MAVRAPFAKYLNQAWVGPVSRRTGEWLPIR